MARHTKRGTSALDRLRERYESTEKKCPECGHVSQARSWAGKTDGSRVVYEFVCPQCGAEREHVFDFRR